MRLFLGLAIGALAVGGAHDARADDTSMVMCEQFAISGATKTVAPVTQLDQDFSPAHHAPRNIPIEVELPADSKTFIHFPIVQDGSYLIYTTAPDRLAGLVTKDGDPIKTSTLAAPQSCSEVLTGGMSAEINEGTLTGPTPIAIEFLEGGAETVRLIVSRDPIE